MTTSHASAFIISTAIIVMVLLLVTGHWIVALTAPVFALVVWFSWGIKHDL